MTKAELEKVYADIGAQLPRYAWGMYKIDLSVSELDGAWWPVACTIDGSNMLHHKNGVEFVVCAVNAIDKLDVAFGFPDIQTAIAYWELTWEIPRG